MAYDPNPNWTSRTDAKAKSPTYFIEFENLPATRFSTVTPRNIVSGKTYKRYLNVPAGLAQKLSQLSGRSSISRLLVNLLDVNGDITKLVGGLEVSEPFSYFPDSSQVETGLPVMGQPTALGETITGHNSQSAGAGLIGALAHPQSGTLQGTLSVNMGDGDALVNIGMYRSNLDSDDSGVSEKFWPGGAWTVRYKVNAVNVDIEVNEIWIARVKRSDWSAEVIGTLKGLNDVLSPVSTLYTRTVICDPSFGGASDHWAIVLVGTNLEGAANIATLEGQDPNVDTVLNSGLRRLLNEKVTLFSGYADLDETDYAPVAILQVQDIGKLGDGVTWRLGLGDVKRHAQDNIMVNAAATQSDPFKTAISSAVTAGDQIIEIADSAGAQNEQTLILGPSSATGFVGKEEVVRVTRDPVLISGGPQARIFLQSGIVNDYAVADLVRWVTSVIEGNPINIIFSVLTGDFSNSSFPLDRVEGLATGLGVDPDDIDQADLIAERDTFFQSETWRFEFTEKLTGLRFLEGRLYRFMGYPRIKGNGKISFRAYGPVNSSIASAGNVPTILQADVLGWSFRKNPGLHLNKLKVGLNSNRFSTTVLEFVEEQDTVDQGQGKETRELEELDTGFKTDLFGERVASARLTALLRRFVSEPTQIKVTCPMTKRALEIGEVIDLTHPEIPDDLGGLGVTGRRMEIVEKAEQFDRETVVFALQDPGFTRPAWIAPDSAPDYDAATALEREYGYIVPDDEDLGDGTPPYEIV